MKQFVSPFLVLLLVCALATPVLAQTTTASPSSTLQTLQTLKSSRTTLKADIKAQRAAYQTKLSEIKDARKKLVLARLTTNIATINSQRTKIMLEALSKMTLIVNKISLKATTAKKNGADTTALLTAIANARTAIATAQTTVNKQAAMEYVLNIDTEETLRSTVGATVKTVQSDLQTTHSSVIAARNAVHTAIVELAKVMSFVNKDNTTDATGGAKLNTRRTIVPLVVSGSTTATEGAAQ